MDLEKRFKEWIKDRDRILKNLETETLDDIIEYCKKWKLEMPQPLFSKEEWVKGSLHKARLQTTKLTNTTDKKLKELQQKSKEELDKLGWDYGVYW